MLNKGFYSFIFAASVFSSSLAYAAELQVASGCSVPVASPSAHVFYFDPVHGSATGDGSEAHPWSSLEALTSATYSSPAYEPPLCTGNKTSSCTSGPLVDNRVYWHYDLVLKKWAFSVNPNAPIHAGDTLLLMSGNYGDLTLAGIQNSSFITIKPAPGQTPVFSSFNFNGSQKFLVEGLKFEALANGYSPFMIVTGGSQYGASKDIIINANIMSSQDDVSSWTVADWISNARWSGISVQGGDPESSHATCVTLTNNTIRNVRFGLGITSDNSLVANNTIDNFGDDAIDFAANNLVLSHNTITNNHDLNDKNHNDAMQAQIGYGIPGKTTFNNILIEGNRIIRQTNPQLPFPGYLQGIDAFDMDWSNVVIANNEVVTNAYHGIAMYSLHGGLIVNNTVLNDGSKETGYNTWIYVASLSHSGSASNNVIVRNNISTSLINGTTTNTIVFDHNLIGQQYDLTVDGKGQWNHKPGTYGNQNVLDQYGLVPIFLQYDTIHMLYNLHLQPGTLAIGTGDATDAPSVDIAGIRRTAPFDLGAYTYVGLSGPLPIGSTLPGKTPPPMHPQGNLPATAGVNTN